MEIITYTKNNTQVYITRNHLDFSTAVDLTQLNDDEKEKFVALKSQKRKKEFLLIRMLKNQLFPEKEISYLTNGAPFFTDHSFSLSISHTSSFIGLAISTNKRVGIDLEEIQQKIIKLAPKFMHSSELKAIQSINNPIHYTHFWCGKEAMYKWSGIDGLSFRNELPIFHKLGSWFGKSIRISNENIPLEMIELENHIVCFTY